jgi:hypothetical protein
VPDPLSLLRFVALVVFIGLVAVGLWLLDVAWWVVPPVMAGALLIAWTIEWVAWRGSITSTVVRETAVPLAPSAPAPVEETRRVETLAPAPPVQADAQTPEPAPPPSRPGPTFEPPPVPEHEEALTGPEPEPSPPKPEPPPQQPDTPPQPETPTPPEPSPSPEPTPPSPEPEPPPPVAREPVASQPAEPGTRRPRRFRLRSVPSPRPEPPPAAPPSPSVLSAPEPQRVVEFRPRTIQPREWNLWDLERLAREEAAVHPERRDEWAFLFVHLRQFATADGALPAEFDGLVRESFGGLLERPHGV